MSTVRQPRSATTGPAPSPASLGRRLEQAGQRATAQRQAVYDHLRSVDDHPTAEDVYLAVRKRLPRVSLATVYNALEVLVRTGLASRLTYGDAAARYDVRTDPHSHLRCLDCGRVADLEVAPDPQWLRGIDTGSFEATEFRFELVGRCGACRA